MDLSDNSAKIIVFKKYDSAIEANVAKTKLDAFGIPCFLSNENMSVMYSLPNMKGMEVALHIFEDDKENVVEVLDSLTFDAR